MWNISISKNKAPPLLLQRVNWSPFRHYHCFYYHSQCLRTKIKFVWGCGASRQSESISISKKKAFLLLFQRLNWSPFRHYHCFYYHSQCLGRKIKFVWGCGASRQSESISISKNKASPLLLQMVNWSPFRHYYCFYYCSQFLRTKLKFVWVCGVCR